MTDADLSILNALSTEIEVIKNNIEIKKSRKALIASSLSSGNWSPFGWTTAQQEIANRSAIKSEYANLPSQIDALNTDLVNKIQAYGVAKNTILSAAEQSAASDIALSNAAIELAKVQAASSKTKLEADQKNFAQKNTKLILYVGIFLVVGVIGVVVYLKFFKKARP